MHKRSVNNNNNNSGNGLHCVRFDWFEWRSGKMGSSPGGGGRQNALISGGTAVDERRYREN